MRGSGETILAETTRTHREAMRTVASNPRANRSITLSTNAGHNAGQRAARAAENAGNGGNFFFFFLPQRHACLPRGTTPMVRF